MESFMQAGMAYGAGKAGEAFDPLTFFQQPQTIVRLVCWLFSIVIFACVANEGYVNRPEEVEEYCVFNRNQNACNYAVGMGTLAFLSCAAFLVLDVYFPQISSVKDRKKAVMADMLASGFWAFVWFVGFCFLANQWQVAKEDDNPLEEGADAARASIIFCFFSIFTWAVQGALAFQRYRQGADSSLFDQQYADPNPELQRAPQGPEYTDYTTQDPQSVQQNYDGYTGYDGSGGYQGDGYQGDGTGGYQDDGYQGQ